MNFLEIHTVLALSLLLFIPATGFAQEAGSSDSTTPEESTDLKRTNPRASNTPRYILDDSTLLAITGDRVERLETPCPSPELLRTADVVFVACGERGVYQLSLDTPSKPKPDGFIDFDEPVVGFLQKNGAVWVEFASGTARRLNVRRTRDADTRSNPPVPLPAAPSGEASDTTREPHRPVGEVVKVLEDSVVVSLGESDGLAEGDRVELFRRDAVPLRDGDTITRVERLAIGKAVDVGNRNARVTVGLNERVPAGGLARPTDGMITENPVAPRRVGDLWEISVAVRPMLALGQIGAGTLNSSRAVYRLDSPFAVHLTTTPFSLGFGDQSTVSALGADALFAYDGQLLSIGLGAGAIDIDDYDSGAESVQSRATLSVSQFVRLGSRDGFNLTLHNAFYLGEDAFRFGGLDGDLQIPLDTIFEDTWAVVHIGGHTSQHILGETGLRVLLRGNGDRGSLFATFTAGAGYVGETIEAPNCEPTYSGDCRAYPGYGGPLVGAELEWRL
jgi:hypothetical protein